MCGIFFSIGFENLSALVIDSVSHRGPDGRGWNEFSSPNDLVVMAHRRLAIVDLSSDGHQPMSSEDKRYWVTYNGEIYNYHEIRKDLEALGCIFKTKTDTEVLLKSYIQWGADCLNHFNGMFAFAIWDDKEKFFFAARDRFGIKPLYYYKQADKIAFASEIKQFKHLPNWKSVLHQEMADEYLEKGYCDHKVETLFKNVFQLLPGEYVCSNSNGSLSFSSWYKLKNHISSKGISDRQAINTFKELFADAIKLRLRADVPIGTCLSGGLDSSSIVSVVRKIQGAIQKIYTFSSVFPSHKVDESVYIDEIVSQKNLTSYKNYPLCGGFLENLDSILYYQDLPFSGTSIFAQWKTFESAKETGVTVLLDGQGADESLLGYSWMLDTVVFDYLKKLDILNLSRFICWQSKYNNRPIKQIILSAIQQRFPRILYILLKILNRPTPVQHFKKLATLNEVCLEHFYNNLQTLLRYADRNSMAFSRESRLPFLDYRLVEFIFSLPINKRLRGAETKWILRKSMQGINVDSILNRQDKIGFATPENDWFEKLKNSDNMRHINFSSFKNFIFARWCENNGFI
ncbi:MAG: asparagine synthase (glutamine-hydrolyzing) [Alphaproteobacteria bacterium]